MKKSFKSQERKASTLSLAEKAHDASLDIYGNWLFNVAQGYSDMKGRVLYRVERLNNFEELHTYLIRKIPIAISIRGTLYGGAWPYKNGHFVVVIGWDAERKRVICLDPAFKDEKRMVRYYRISDFVRAWGKSRNLSYVALPQKWVSKN